VKRTYKYRLYPTTTQRQTLERTLNMCRLLYNNALAERKQKYEREGNSPSYYEQKRNLVNAKLCDPSLTQAHSQVLQDVILRIDKAFKHFFRRIKKGAKAGYPRFKGRNRYDSFTYPQYGNGVSLGNGRLTLSKIGSIRILQHREIPSNARIKTCTVRRDVDRWYACFTIEFTHETSLKDVKNMIGVDMGLESLITLSNGEKTAPPRYLGLSERKLRREQRRLSRREKGSANRAKQQIRVAKIHRKIREQRRDFTHKLSRQLVNRYDLIAFENLNVVNMIHNRHLAKSIADSGWNMLQTFTAYKAEEAGKLVKFVTARDTSLICSRCSFPVSKTLSTRTHRCHNCGLVLDRDWNAALNILKRVRWGTAELTPAENSQWALNETGSPLHS